MFNIKSNCIVIVATARKCKRDYRLAWCCWQHHKGNNKGICNWVSCLGFLPSLQCIHGWGVIIFWHLLHHGMRYIISNKFIWHGLWKCRYCWFQLDMSIMFLGSAFHLRWISVSWPALSYLNVVRRVHFISSPAMWDDLTTNRTADWGAWCTFGQVDIAIPEVFVAGLLGSMLIFLFSAWACAAVGRTAQEVVNEVRRQFQERPGIMVRWAYLLLNLYCPAHGLVYLFVSCCDLWFRTLLLSSSKNRSKHHNWHDSSSAGIPRKARLCALCLYCCICIPSWDD